MRGNVNDAQLLSPVMTCATEGAVMCSREKVCCARSRKCILCTLPVAFSELRLAGRENATKKKKQFGWQSDFAGLVENHFLEVNYIQFPEARFDATSHCY